eukprot:jgi/Bigna1/90520/estExt_fgenesh1_pg.C_720069
MAYNHRPQLRGSCHKPAPHRKALSGASRFAGAHLPWYKSCAKWCISFCCPVKVDQRLEINRYHSMETLRAKPSSISLGRPNYTDLSKMHDAGSYDLQNWAITRSEEKDSVCLITLPKDELKIALREGIPSLKRPSLWPKLVCEEKKFQKLPHYTELLYEVFYGEIPNQCSKEVAVPDFGGALMFSSHPILSEGIEEVRQMLCVLKQHFGAVVTYCPVLPDLAAVLLHYVAAKHIDYYRIQHYDIQTEFKCAMRVYVNMNLKQDGWYFAVSGFDFEREAKNFIQILQAGQPTLARHFEQAGFNLEDTVKVWFGRFFVSFFPYDTILRLMDVYLNEGSKTLFRVALSVLKIHAEQLLQCRTAEEIALQLAKSMRMQTNMEQLFRCAFQFKVHRRQFKSFIKFLKPGVFNESQADIESCEIHQIPVARVQMYMYMIQITTLLPFSVNHQLLLHVFHVPKYKPERYSLMTTSECRQLWTFLPPLLRYLDPELRFATYRDGFCLGGILRCMDSAMKEKRPIIMLLKDSNENLFGAVLDWRKGLFAGSETFLFTLRPEPRRYLQREARKQPIRQRSAERPRVSTLSVRQHEEGMLSSSTFQSPVERAEDLKKWESPILGSGIGLHDDGGFTQQTALSPGTLELRRIFPKGMTRLKLTRQEMKTKIEDTIKKQFYLSADSLCPAGSTSNLAAAVAPKTTTKTMDAAHRRKRGSSSSVHLASLGRGEEDEEGEEEAARTYLPLERSFNFEVSKWRQEQKGNRGELHSGSTSFRQSVSYRTFDSLKRAQQREGTSLASKKDIENFRYLVSRQLEHKGDADNSRRIPLLQITPEHFILSCDGRVALALNSDVSVGFSHRTLGWNNPPLTKVSSLDNSFQVRHVELWGFEGY